MFRCSKIEPENSKLSDLDGEREVTCPDGFHQEHAFPLCRLNELLCLCGVHGEGFLAQHVLAAEQTEHGVLEVVRVRCGYVDYVDVGVGYELGVSAVGFG